jgi:glyoxylate reductase
MFSLALENSPDIQHHLEDGEKSIGMRRVLRGKAILRLRVRSLISGTRPLKTGGVWNVQLEDQSAVERRNTRKKPRVFVAGRINPPAMDLLRAECHVQYYDKRVALSKQRMKKAFRESDAVVCFAHNRIGKDIIEAADHVKVISSYTVAADNIDVEEATKKGIYVALAPAMVHVATADLTWAILMAIARRIPEADSYVRQGKWKWWSPELFVGADLYGRTLGIVGAGRIGIGVAKRAKGFNMKTQYYDVVRSPFESELGLKYTSLEEVMSTSDFVCVHVPLSDKTYHLIGERELGLMKPTAYLINASRGPVVDEKALAKALRAGKISGAGLDVFDREPIDNRNALTKLSNVVLTPHIGSSTRENRYEESKQVADNILTLLRGEMTDNVVNTSVQRIRPLSEIKMI